MRTTGARNVAVLLAVWCATAGAGLVTAQTAVAGDVRTAEGKPAGGVTVVLVARDGTRRNTVSDGNGGFRFRDAGGAGTLEATASNGERTAVVLENSGAPVHLRLQRAMDFSDEPNFSVAGVTDWTAVGGHGSDATLRTSEELTRETVVLQHAPEGSPALASTEATLRSALLAQPHSYDANHALGEFYLQQGHPAQAVPLLRAASALRGGAAADEYALALACSGMGDVQEARRHVDRALLLGDGADFHRLAGELDERMGEPVLSVRQMQRAAALEPTEENYFAWGSELLLHRAVWQAAQVFAQGTARFPQSTRMQTGWGSALFAGARYDEAAEHLCRASDLDPANRESYVLLGKAALAAPEPLPCAAATLERFVQREPDDADANFYRAMLLLREGSPTARERAVALLQKAVSFNPRMAAALLQLGIVEAAQHHLPEAIVLFRQAVAADPQLAEAHYRLGMALDRTGSHEEAQKELKLHEEIAAAQADAVEQQRRQVKQFLVTLKPTP